MFKFRSIHQRNGLQCWTCDSIQKRGGELWTVGGSGFSTGLSPQSSFFENRASEGLVEIALSERESPYTPSIFESSTRKTISGLKSPLEKEREYNLDFIPLFEEEEVLLSESLSMILKFIWLGGLRS